MLKNNIKRKPAFSTNGNLICYDFKHSVVRKENLDVSSVTTHL